jgi:hypothetical protein
MIYFLIFYVIPGVINALLLQKFIDYQGGVEYIKENWDGEWKDEYYPRMKTVMILTPVFNFINGVFLLIWYVREILN